MTAVVSLRDLGRDDVALAGGKGANLGELIKAGFAVPDGFVVTAEAYAATLEAAGLSLPDAAEDDPAGFRDRVAQVSISDALWHEIQRAYAALGGGPVAVRSSATAEDLPGATFAGQQDTELNVIGADQLLDAVRRCWASLWTERAVAYRRRRRIEPSEVKIAVVVQRMVPADIAGVMFTANPVTGARDQVVIDASGGLGEAVVSGAVTPDHYVLDSDGRLIEFSPGRREVAIVAKAGGGVERQAGMGQAQAGAGESVQGVGGLERQAGGAAQAAAGLHSGDTGDRLLTEETLRALSALSGDVMRHFGQPQDIEWALSGDELWLLQARPMTALPPPPERLNRFQRTQGAIVLELLPVRPYPIDMTTWIPYGPVGWMAKLTSFYGIQGAFDELFEEDADGVVVRFVPASPRPSPAVLRVPYRLLSRAARFDPARWRDDPRYASFLMGIAALARRDPAAMTWPELVGSLRQALAQIDPVFELRIDYLPGTGLAAARLFAVLRLLGRRDLFFELVTGADTLTARANLALEALAEEVRADPALDRALAEGGVERLSDFPEFAAEFEAYLAAYGHRETASPILVSQPTWSERPDMVLDLVRSLAQSAPKPAPENKALRQLLDHPLLRYQRPRRVVERWVAAARAGLGFREDSHAEFIRPLPMLRRALLEVGRRLTAAGVLDTPEDVYHLRLTELESIRELDSLSAQNRERLRDTMRRRAARREELAGVPLIDPSLVFQPPASEEALVRGTPAGGGRATGAVRVVHGPEEFATLQAGEILVCPYTNPAWTPLFQRAAAVVVDSGGPGSHAAIVAREYGLPAIMGTIDGSRRLADGQRVTVDGGSGLVVSAEGS
jgi:rifampicin phosphotransferase